MTSKELQKYHVIKRLVQGDINGIQAAQMLSMSTRHIRRMKQAYKIKGTLAFIHGQRGKPGNRRISKKIRRKAIRQIREYYSDFKPTFATEKLAERHKIHLSVETIRKLMIQEGIWREKKRKITKTYRAWRPRRSYYGQMQQFDGSYHNWFERKNKSIPEACLLAAIDDATGAITHAQFDVNESVRAVFSFWKNYVKNNGKPVSIYLDKYSTYKINHKNAVDNHELITHFQKTVRELDINLITAHSPQAKGRIERLFGTLQDRLVKELRLAGISDIKTANQFLRYRYIPEFNKKFAVVPLKQGDVHKPLTEIDKKYIDRIFSVQSTRQINKDFTIRFKNKWYQLKQIQKTTLYHHNKVIVEEWINGSIHINSKGIYLDYMLLPDRPKKMHIHPVLITTHKTNWTPPADHPWRKYQQTL